MNFITRTNSRTNCRTIFRTLTWLGTWLSAAALLLSIAACSDNRSDSTGDSGALPPVTGNPAVVNPATEKKSTLAPETLAPETLAAEKSSLGEVTLKVYKSPDCGCCEDWITHIEASGFAALNHHPEDLKQVKRDHAIAPAYQSCHTAVTDNGYVFEGHVPAHLMQRFLAAPPPNAIGLAVPGMPAGSPGMEMGDRYDDYAVLLLKKDGSTQVYEFISGNSR